MYMHTSQHCRRTNIHATYNRTAHKISSVCVLQQADTPEPNTHSISRTLLDWLKPVARAAPLPATVCGSATQHRRVFKLNRFYKRWPWHRARGHQLFFLNPFTWACYGRLGKGADSRSVSELVFAWPMMRSWHGGRPSGTSAGGGCVPMTRQPLVLCWVSSGSAGTGGGRIVRATPPSWLAMLNACNADATSM